MKRTDKHHGSRILTLEQYWLAQVDIRNHTPYAMHASRISSCSGSWRSVKQPLDLLPRTYRAFPCRPRLSLDLAVMDDFHVVHSFSSRCPSFLMARIWLRRGEQHAAAPYTRGHLVRQKPVTCKVASEHYANTVAAPAWAVGGRS